MQDPALDTEHRMAIHVLVQYVLDAQATWNLEGFLFLSQAASTLSLP